MNKHGQAVIESLIVGLIMMAGLFFILKKSIYYYQKMAIDEWIEQALICSFEYSTDFCKTEFLRKLSAIQIKESNIKLSLIQNKNKSYLSLKLFSNENKIIEKESELKLELDSY